MFDGLLMNKKTLDRLSAFVKRPSHALILVGQPGSGKVVLAKHLAAELLSTDYIVIDKHPFFTHLAKAEKVQNITIDEIRLVKKSLRLKTPTSSAKAKRVILIEDAHHMNQEAQNALLKSLEEPNPKTLFILTTTDTSQLLPTVVSRAVIVPVLPIGLSQALDNYSQYEKDQITSAWHLSGGNQELLAELLTDEKHDIKLGLSQAKSLLKMSKYERIIWLDSISQNKEETKTLLETLSKLLKALYKASIKHDNHLMTSKLVANAALVEQTKSDLRINSNNRLAMLALGLKLKV